MNITYQTKQIRGGEAYERHRIPGILITRARSILIWFEARDTGSDWARMDILCRRSTDGGKHFSSPILLAQGSEEHPTVNNPVMMEDRHGRIHLLYCEDYTVNGGRILHRISTDDGVSFSEPRDLTAFAKPALHDAFALGPGHGILLTSGRLLVPIWMVPKGAGDALTSHTPSVISTFYSDDDGETWALGEILGDIRDADYCPDNHTGGRFGITSPNETVAAQLPDGEIYLNIRQRGPKRAHAWSQNGAEGWQNYGPDDALTDPMCFGSVAVHPNGNLYLVHCAHPTSRTHVTLRESRDGGRTWNDSLCLDEERGGYCDLAIDPISGSVYVLYEDKFGTTDWLATLELHA